MNKGENERDRKTVLEAHVGLEDTLRRESH